MSGSTSVPVAKAYHLWTPLDPATVQERLALGATGVTHDTFLVGVRAPGAHLPVMEGRYEAADGGTYLVIEPKARAQLLILAMLLLAIVGPLAPVVMGVLAFSRFNQDRKMVEALKGRLEVREDGARAVARLNDYQVADPTSEGAITGAPRSFAVRTAFDGATFHLRGAGGHTRQLEISQQGLRLQRQTGPLRLDWMSLDRIDLQQGMLVLETRGQPVMIDIVDHTEDDRIWLALYLGACNERWSSSREEHERERARLARLANERST